MGILVLGTKSATEDTSAEQAAFNSGERKTFFVTGLFTKANESFGFYYKDGDGLFDKLITTIDGYEAVLCERRNTLTLGSPCPPYVIKKTTTGVAMGINKIEQF